MSSERFVYPTSIAEVPAFYDTQLLTATAPYAMLLRPYITWADDPSSEVASGKPLGAHLQDMVAGVQDTLNDRAKRISAVMGAIPDVVYDMPDFHQRDRSVLHDALGRITFSGTVREIDALASSEEARQALRVMLDQRVLMNAAGSISLRARLQDAQHYGATVTSKQAMRAAYDAWTFQEIRNAPTLIGARGSHLLNKATSADYVADAMLTAVDAKVYDEAKRSIFEQSGRRTITMYASSTAAAQWMLHCLYRDPIPHQEQYKQQEKQWWYDHVSDTRIPPREGWPQQETTAPERDDHAVYESVMAKVTLTAAKTLGGMERAEVARVVRTIEAVRQKAAQEGREVSDREIYLRFAKRSNNAAEPNPAHVRATQIAQLLMQNNQFVC